MAILDEEEFRHVYGVYEKLNNVFYSLYRAMYDPNPLIDDSMGNFGTRVRSSFLYEAYEIITNNPSGELISLRELPFWYINSITTDTYQNGRMQYEGRLSHFPPFESSAIGLARTELSLFEDNHKTAFLTVATKEEEKDRTIFQYIKKPFDIDEKEKMRFMTGVVKAYLQWREMRGAKGRIPLERIWSMLSVEKSLMYREHPEFYRKLEAEQAKERQAQEDEIFLEWGLTLDRECKELTRGGYEIPVSLSPNEIKYFTYSAQNVRVDFERLEIKKESFETAVSKLRSKLSPLGITISYGDYRLEETAKSPGLPK